MTAPHGAVAVCGPLPVRLLPAGRWRRHRRGHHPGRIGAML